MTKTTTLLDTVKQTHGLTSNYQLAKKLEIRETYISLAYAGRKNADEYMATRIALALDLDPMTVIAELRADDEKNAKQKEFWRNFLTRAASVVALLTALHFGNPSSDAAENMLNENGRDDEGYDVGILQNVITNYANLAKAWTRAAIRLWRTCVLQVPATA